MTNPHYITPNIHEGRFAEEEEIREKYHEIDYRSGDVKAAGLHILSDGTKAVVDDSESSTITVAASASGKTRRVLMPYALSCIMKEESMVIHDPRGEINKHLNTTLEEQGYNIIILDYRNPMNGDRYNPLEYPANLYQSGDKSRAMEMFQSFSNTLFSQYASEKDPFWHLTSAMYFTSLMTLCCEEYPANMCTINNLYDLHIQGTDRCGGSTYMREIYRGKETSVGWKLAAATVTAPNDTRSSLHSVFTGCLSGLVQNENIIDMSTNSTFQVKDLIEKKTALFIITRDEASVYNSLISATIDQIYSILVSMAEEKYCGRLPRRVEFILDEFGNLAKIYNMEMKITASRARNIRFHLVCQSLNQLELIYGKEIAPIIIGNCNNLVYLFSSDYGLLKMISDRCGNTINEYTNEKAPLLSVEHLQHLNKESGECLMLLDRTHPFIAHLPDISEYAVKPIKNINVSIRKRQELPSVNLQELVNGKIEEIRGTFFKNVEERKKEREKSETAPENLIAMIDNVIRTQKEEQTS